MIVDLVKEVNPSGEMWVSWMGNSKWSLRVFCWHKSREFSDCFLEPWPAGTQSPWHPGYALAFRCSVLRDIGGLFEAGMLGSGDFEMLMGLYKKAELSIPDGAHPNYSDAVLAWQEHAQAATQGKIGYLRMTIEHAFHGFKVDRQYESRQLILVDEQFDPTTFLHKNNDGVWEVENTDRTRRFIERCVEYFIGRNEDVGSPFPPINVSQPETESI